MLVLLVDFHEKDKTREEPPYETHLQFTTTALNIA